MKVTSYQLSVFNNQCLVVSRRGLLVGLLLVVGWIGLSLTPMVRAQDAPGDVGNIAVQINKESATLMAGDWIDFNTTLQNNAAAATLPLVAHLSVAAVDRNRHVDPEDWSPQRTQYVPPLQPGESVELHWRLHALFEGEFATFITVLSLDDSFVPAMSTPLQLHVTPDDILPMNMVIPVVAIVPFFPLSLLLVTGVYNKKKRSR